MHSKNAFHLSFTQALLGWIYSSCALASPVNVILENVPSSHTTQTIVVAGSFNDWDLSSPRRIEMIRDNDTYYALLPDSTDTLLFNLFKQGEWHNPLATSFGKPFTCGFLHTPNSNSEYKITFNGWANQQRSDSGIDTISGQVTVISDFDFPPLQRQGDIFVYLPPNYTQQADTHYPVLYVLDGQNLFSELTSYSDEWQVDETLLRLGLDIIVVGISNGSDRWQEYNPWDAVNYRGEHAMGKGELTFEFIKKHLKPYIDTRFRTREEANYTGIAGSSLGGLMVLYAAIQHQDVFSKFAAFSPSFSFRSMQGQTNLSPLESNLLQAIKLAKASPKSKVYYDVGEIEYGSYTLIDALHNALTRAGYQDSHRKMVKDDAGRHCERDWSKRLPEALSWLYNEATSN